MSSEKTVKTKEMMRVTDLVYIAIGAALIAICSWISIPTAVPFTLQTFAVFFVLLLLGGERGTLSTIVYVILGAIGLPVFAGFSGQAVLHRSFLVEWTYVLYNQAMEKKRPLTACKTEQ